MEVQVIKSFMFGGKPVPVGAIIDMPPSDAAYVVALKRAEKIGAPVAPADAAEARPPRARKARSS